MYKNIKGEVREGKGRGKSCFFFVVVNVDSVCTNPFSGP